MLQALEYFLKPAAPLNGLGCISVLGHSGCIWKEPFRIYQNPLPLYIKDSTSLLNTTVSTKYKRKIQNKIYQSNRRAGSFKHKIGLFSHKVFCSIPLSQSSCYTQPTKKTPNSSRLARLQWGEARSSVKPDNSYSHKYYSHFLNRRETEVTKTNSLAGSKSSGGIFILLLQAE